MTILFFFTALTICFVFYLNNLTGTSANKNILLNTTLPITEISNDEVLKIIKEFKRENNIIILIEIAAFIPCFAKFSDYYSGLQFLTWCFFVFILNYLSKGKYMSKIRKLKMLNNWFIENKHIISIDTEVSRLKNKMPISALWLIPSFAISIGIIVYGLWTKWNAYDYKIILASSSFFITIISLIIHKILSSERTKVYSSNSSINLACNLVYKRTWSIVFVLMATFQSVFTLFSCFMNSYMVTLSFSIFAISTLLIYIGYIKIRSTQNRILKAADKIIYTDNDEYWGVFGYNNPNDSNLFVEKRMGIGLALNIGNPKGKVILIISFIIVLLTISSVGFHL